jgi:hypothetical protein
MQDKPLELPPGYLLDASDPDVLILRRLNGSSVAAFVARSADPTEVRNAAEVDQRVRNAALGKSLLSARQRRTPSHRQP